MAIFDRILDALGQATGGIPILIWLDVAPDGRVLYLAPKLRRYLGKAQRDSDRFSVAPETKFFAALDRACRPDHPMPTVLQIPVGDDAAVVRINVLPAAIGRARLVLFVDGQDIEDPAARLTPRERAVLELLGSGLRRERIAWKLNISVPTVDMHTNNLRRKLSALTTFEAIAKAAHLGIIGG